MVKEHESLIQILNEEARASGFLAYGGVDIARGLREPIFEEVLQTYDRYLASGRQGGMDYLRRGRDHRRDPRFLFPEAKSVFCVVLPYRKAPAGSISPKDGPRYARYLHGRDYHLELRERLEKMMARASERYAKALKWKTCSDTSAVIEKTWAALSGMGWIGKNTLLIHPKLGSFFFLGEVLLSEELGLAPQLLPSLCGHCERCLKACPTGAFTAPRSLDPRLCTSYLTLEKRGDFESDPALLARMGTWVAGCDLCQEVCPFNTKPSRAAEDLPPAQAIEKATWAELLRESDADYEKRVTDSSLDWVKPDQFRRNLAQAFLNAWSGLQPDERRLFAEEHVESVKERLAREAEPVVREFWARALDQLAEALSGRPMRIP